MLSQTLCNLKTITAKMQSMKLTIKFIAENAADFKWFSGFQSCTTMNLKKFVKAVDFFEESGYNNIRY